MNRTPKVRQKKSNFWESVQKPLDDLFFYPDTLCVYLKSEDLPLEILFLQKLVYLFRLVLRRKDHNSRPRS